MENARSMAYLMSLVLTSRFTGGAYLTPFLMLTVIVLLSDEISGSPSARSGTGLTESSGLNEYSVRFVGVLDHVAERVVRLARVHVVDVAGGQIGQRAALLALR